MGSCSSKASGAESIKKTESTQIKKGVEDKIELAFKMKRANVFSKGINTATARTTKKIPKNPTQTQFILEALSKIYVFSSLSREDILLLAEAMDFQSSPKDENIIVQGQEGDYFYILDEGIVSVIVNGEEKATLGRGMSFGELALLYNSPRTATIKCVQNCTFFTLDRETFRVTLARESDARTKTIIESLKKVTLLAELNEEQIEKLADTVEIVHTTAGDEIIRKGTEGNIFYMIKKGTVRVSDIGEKFSDHNITEGNYFGERALMTGEPRMATITSLTDCELFALDRTTFTQFLGPLKDLLDHNMNMRVLASIKMFERLTIHERARVAKSFDLNKYPSGSVIIREGDRGQKFYIIKDGEVSVLKGEEKVATLKQGNFFGEMALLSDEKRTATIKAESDCECFELDRPTFTRLQDSLKHVFDSEASSRREHMKAFKTDEEAGYSLANLQHIALLGTGTFGRVTLVMDKKSKCFFALKTMLKSEIREQNQIINVVNEKNIMQQCTECPFVLRLFQSFKDSRKLYMLLEFVQGGELFNIIHSRDSDGIPDDQARFYAAGVLEAISYLHSQSIAYRDMKPENCLLDKLGYPKLIDFGFAKVIHNKSYTLCGTPEYLAPELVLGRGHNKAVDYWALGILIFEMEAGYSPFSDQQHFDHVVICKNIVSNQPKFPRSFSIDCKDIVKKLLASNAQQRLGNLKDGAEDIRTHRWFKGLDFDLYRKKQLKAPWTPRINNPTDLSHFHTQGLENDHPDSGIDIADDWGF